MADVSLYERTHVSIEDLVSSLDGDDVLPLMRALFKELPREDQARIRTRLRKNDVSDRARMLELQCDHDVDAEELLGKCVSQLSNGELADVLHRSGLREDDGDSERIVREAIAAVRKLNPVPREIDELFYRLHNIIL